MRLTSLAAGILTLALTGLPGLSAVTSRAAGAPARVSQSLLTSRPRGPEQTNQQQPGEFFARPLKIQTNLVNVFATVRDKKNGIISDLTQDDFKIYEDGMEQKVAFFSKDVNLPITLAILIDTQRQHGGDSRRGAGCGFALCPHRDAQEG